MKEQPAYSITTIRDFLKIPESYINRALIDFGNAIKEARKRNERLQVLINEGIVPDDTEIIMDSIVITDDNGTPYCGGRLGGI